MRTRVQLAAAQIAVFVGGGLLGPVAHVAWHRPGHSHGPGGQAIVFEVEAHGRAVHRHAHPLDSADRAGRQGRPRGHEGATSSGDIPMETRSPTGNARARPATVAEPLDSTHGHGSIAHLGLALLSAAAPLALPTPEPAGVAPRAMHPRVTAFFQPSFPLPRPPPEAAPS